MYKFLLCWRYLRSRWIALASIVSVTLGVATLIVVNSVMAGFSSQMRDRIHAILADVTLESRLMQGFPNPEEKMSQIRQALGDKLEATTPTVEVFGMLSFKFAGEWVTSPVRVVGIDPEGRARVGHFAEHLLDEFNRNRPSFELSPEALAYREKRFSPPRTPAPLEPSDAWPTAPPMSDENVDENPDSTTDSSANPSSDGKVVATTPSAGVAQANQAVSLPDIETMPDEDVAEPTITLTEDGGGDATAPSEDPFARSGESSDPTQPTSEDEATDRAAPQALRIIPGYLLMTFRHAGADGQARDVYMVKPGDDVQLTVPTAGRPPKPAHANATVVDFFKSSMSEYDANLVYVPLEQLQYLRGMVDEETGTRYATTIQLKLKNYADAPAVVAKLREMFPPTKNYLVHTWEQQQGPLLAAVDIEAGILNVLLFLIIAVAGFGILAIFFMIVVEKTRDIGILKAVGASSRGVMGIFLSYGLSLGVVGSGLGMVLGLLFVRYINEIEGLVSQLTGHKVFDERIYYFSSIPTLVNPMTVAWIVGGALLIAVSASILPARRAARLHPVEALRYDQ